jgi:uncharacterized protein DUF5677
MFVLIANFSKSVIDSYVKSALRHERKLRDAVEANIRNRGGLVRPIEDRMLQSIRRMERAAEISLDDIDPMDRRPWGEKNISEKTRDVELEMAYRAAFGGGSQTIHGNWNEVYGNHLSWNASDGSFTPRTEWKNPRPQVVTALALIVLETIKIYFDFMVGEDVGEHFETRLLDLHTRINILDQAHEDYLANRKWPET